MLGARTLPFASRPWQPEQFFVNICCPPSEVREGFDCDCRNETNPTISRKHASGMPDARFPISSIATTFDKPALAPVSNQSWQPRLELCAFAAPRLAP